MLPDNPEIPTTTDPLAEALQHLRMDGMFYCKSELTVPWGLFLPALPDCLWFHVITSGECVLIDSQDRHHRLRRGDATTVELVFGRQADQPH